MASSRLLFFKNIVQNDSVSDQLENEIQNSITSWRRKSSFLLPMISKSE
jgi:hypothetical protein